MGVEYVVNLSRTVLKMLFLILIANLNLGGTLFGQEEKCQNKILWTSSEGF